MTEPYYQDDAVTVLTADCLVALADLEDASVDAVVTDPPYGLEFMGKEWDRPWASAFTAIGDGAPLPDRPLHINSRCRRCGGYMRGTKNKCECVAPEWTDTQAKAVGRKNREFQSWCELWAAECLRVLKPGGHMLAFGGTRTAHRLAAGIEDAGFEIRDTIAWLYGSGFPKSRNLDGDWQGWGTALKPANEPILVARKSPIGTVSGNVEAHGVGALNIDGCRVSFADDVQMQRTQRQHADTAGMNGLGESGFRADHEQPTYNDRGRWPSNVCLDGDAAAELDGQSGLLTSGANPSRRGSDKFRTAYGDFTGQETCQPARGVDVGGASRFFPTFHYEPKAPTTERPNVGGVMHPTVKPLDLMRWLVRLVTPPGGLVLDPFLGSGTTAEACVIEGFRCIGIEREADYLPLILARLSKPIQPDMFGGAA